MQKKFQQKKKNVLESLAGQLIKGEAVWGWGECLSLRRDKHVVICSSLTILSQSRNDDSIVLGLWIKRPLHGREITNVEISPRC